MEVADLKWRTASYSSNGGGNCIEVADHDNAVLVRDTKNRAGVILRFSPAAWRRYVVQVRRSLASDRACPQALADHSLLPQLFYLLDLAGPPATGHAARNLRGLPEPGDRFGETLVEADRSDIREQGVQTSAVGL